MEDCIMYANDLFGKLLGNSNAQGKSIWVLSKALYPAVAATNYDHDILFIKVAHCKYIEAMIQAGILSPEQNEEFCHKAKISNFDRTITWFQNQLDFDPFSRVKWAKTMCLQEINLDDLLLAKKAEDESFGVDSADVSA